MNSYNLSREWFNFSFKTEEVKSLHTALYFFIIDTANRLGWKERFNLDTFIAMEALKIKSSKTYSNTLNSLENFGFIKIHEKKKNQHTSNVVALVKNTKANTKANAKADNKALDKAMLTQSQSTDESTNQGNNESTCQSIGEALNYIYKTTNNKQLNKQTIKKLDKNPSTFFEFLENESDLIFSKKNEKEKVIEVQKINPDKVVSLFNQLCVGLPKVKTTTKKRKEAITKKIRDHGLNKITEVFRLANDSKFLNGENSKLWSANFDWLMNEANFVKVLEGNYKNKNKTPKYSAVTIN